LRVATPLDREEEFTTEDTEFGNAKVKTENTRNPRFLGVLCVLGGASFCTPWCSFAVQCTAKLAIAETLATHPSIIWA
jgi:hypothetical protein